MTAPATAEYFANRGCMPDQAQFAADFFAPEAPRIFTLISPSGTGKGFTAAEICSYFVTSGGHERVLVVTGRRELANQFEDLLRSRNPELPVVVVTRRIYWELEADVAADVDLWPARGVVIIALDILQHEDVRKGLLLGSWGLLVLDDPGPHDADAANAAFLLVTQFSETRILYLTRNIPTNIDWPVRPATAGERGWSAMGWLASWGFGAIGAIAGTMPIGISATGSGPASAFEEDRVVTWTRDLDMSSEPSHDVVAEVGWMTFARIPEERALVSRLQQLLGSMCPDAENRQLALTICKAAASCTYSLEYALRGLRIERNRIMHGMSQHPATDDSSVVELAEVLRRLIPLIEAVPADSKTKALIDAIEAMPIDVPGRARGCVFTRFASTVDYLKSTLGEQFDNVYTLSNRMTAEKRSRVVRDCAEAQGILIFTTGVSMDLPPTGLLLLYDLPAHSAILDARFSQFVQVCGGTPPCVLAFEDTTRSLEIEAVEREAFKARRPPDDADITKAVFPNPPSAAGLD